MYASGLIDCTGRFGKRQAHHDHRTPRTRRPCLALLAAGLALCTALLAAGCGHGDGIWIIDDMYTSVAITVPDGMTGDEEANWSVTWAPRPSYLLSATPNANEAAGPFTVVWNFGNGAEPNTITHTDVAGDTDAATVTMLNDSATENANYTVQVTVTNAEGGSSSATLTYTVAPAPAAPQITSAVYDEATQTVTVEVEADARALPVTVSLSLPPELTADPPSLTLTEAPLVAVFTLHSNAAPIDQYIFGGNGAYTISAIAMDALGRADEESLAVTVSLPGFVLTADALYVVPLAHEAKVGDTVTVVVLTGVPAHPFQYLPDVNVTYPDWVHYAPDTFNIGAPGGNPYDADGIWGTDGMGLEAYPDFLPQPDVFPPWYEQQSDFGIPDRHRLQLNVIPLGGHDLTGESGVLLNFRVTFDHTGTASFGFLEATPPIDRTYYRDSGNNDYFWGTLSAGPDGTLNVTGIDNTVVVTE